MKKLSLILFIFYIKTASAQIEHPVKWRYGLKNISGSTYEVHLLATIEFGWHIYAQKQPNGAIAVPTKIIFRKVSGLELMGIPREIGMKDVYVVPEVNITNYEYANKVDFVQKVKIRPGTKNIQGQISFQVCTHTKCLPEDSIDFSIPVN